LPQIYGHQVDEDEVTEVLEKPGEDRAAREGSIRETARGISQAKKEETTMSRSKFPTGWDEEKVRRVLAHYEEQTDEDAVLEDEAGMEPSETVMNVPHDLVPKVRELIAKRRS